VCYSRRQRLPSCQSAPARATIGCRQHSSATGSFAEHSADHLAFYRRGRCANPDNVDDWLTINPDSFDVHEMHCQVLVARANKRGDYLAKFRCDDNLIQNYWFSLFNDRLYVSQTDTEP
jgi:hypothetical protein